MLQASNPPPPLSGQYLEHWLLRRGRPEHLAWPPPYASIGVRSDRWSSKAIHLGIEPNLSRWPWANLNESCKNTERPVTCTENPKHSNDIRILYPLQPLLPEMTESQNRDDLSQKRPEVTSRTKEILF